jgi:hypothetical protein
MNALVILGRLGFLVFVTRFPAMLSCPTSSDRFFCPHSWNGLLWLIRIDSTILPPMSMLDGPITNIIRLRLIVGFLGEKRQASWWDSGFVDSTGARFLSATFPRTFLVAGIRSVTETARLLHDSQIGRVGVFHLFRLPVDVEDQLEAHLFEVTNGWAKPALSDREDALIELRKFIESRISAPKGPVQIGVPGKILRAATVSELAAHYESAFSSGFQCFPYFAPATNGKR